MTRYFCDRCGNELDQAPSGARLRCAIHETLPLNQQPATWDVELCIERRGQVARSGLFTESVTTLCPACLVALLGKVRESACAEPPRPAIQLTPLPKAKAA